MIFYHPRDGDLPRMVTVLGMATIIGMMTILEMLTIIGIIWRILTTSGG